MANATAPFARLGRHLNYRGAMVDVELTLWGTTHNLLKHIRHVVKQVRTTTSATPVPVPA